MGKDWSTRVIPAEHFDRIWALAMVYLPGRTDITPEDRIVSAVKIATEHYLGFVDRLHDIGTSIEGDAAGHLTADIDNDTITFKLVLDPQPSTSPRDWAPHWLPPST